MSIDNTNYTGPDHLRDMAKIGCEETYDEQPTADEQMLEMELSRESLIEINEDLYDYSDTLSGLDRIVFNENGELD